MIFMWAGVGALVGASGAVLVRSGPWWTAAVVHYAIPYVLLIALIAVGADRVRSAAVRAGTCFIAFVVAYYGVVALQYGAVPTLYASAWLGAAVTVCPIGAAVLRWARDRDGLLPAAAFASAGAVALSDGAVGNLVRAAVGRLDPSLIQPVTFSTAAIGLLVAGIVVLLPRRRRTRIRAALLLPALAVVTTSVGWMAHFGIGPYL